MMIAAVVVFSGAFANVPPEHNCFTRELWSQEKRDWCCANKQLGCPNPAACICTKIYLPVCGEDNKTYSNKCVAKCNGQSKFTIGKCRANEDSVACTCKRIFSPVCGSDNKTYSNACVAKCNGQLEFTNGKCRVNAAFTARFERAEATLNEVSVGPNGKASIIITRTLSGKVESTLLHAEYLRGSRALEGVEGFEFSSGSRREWKPNDNMSQFPITFPSTNTSSNVTITKVGSSWKLSFGRDSNDEAVELKMDVLPRDCKAAAETSTAAEALTDASTTEITTDSPETLSLDGRRLEAKETTSAPETEIPDETEEEESSSCDPGFSCDPMLKSCQLIKKTLPAGSAGKLKSNSGAIQNSSCAILAAMVTYLMI